MGEFGFEIPVLRGSKQVFGFLEISHVTGKYVTQLVPITIGGFPYVTSKNVGIITLPKAYNEHDPKQGKIELGNGIGNLAYSPVLKSKVFINLYSFHTLVNLIYPYQVRIYTMNVENC